MNQVTKCKLCKIAFNFDTRQGLIISCGHTFCKSCILKKQDSSSCPLCGLQINFANTIINYFVEEVLKVIAEEQTTNNSNLISNTQNNLSKL